MTFLEHIQQECGGEYPLRDILDNLDDDQIIESINNYTLKALNKSSDISPIIESADDKGYFYCPAHTWSMTESEITEDVKCPDCGRDAEFIEWERAEPIGQWRKYSL